MAQVASKRCEGHKGPVCAKCGSDDVEWEVCCQCFGDGEFDLHDEDPVNYAEREEYERCSECDGHGGYQVCHTCAAEAKANG